MNVAHLLTIHIYSLFNNCTVSVHHYISKVCEENLSKMKDEMGWAPKKVCFVNKIIRDGKADTFEKLY